MIACPECGEKSQTIETRATAAGARRRRRCANGHLITTLEVVLLGTGTGRHIGDVLLVPRAHIDELTAAFTRFVGHVPAKSDPDEPRAIAKLRGRGK